MASITELVALLVSVVELSAVAVICVGALTALVRVVMAVASRHGAPVRLVGIRLDMGRWLALGLEFQLAADLLRTAVAPSFRDIGQLAAVAAIRTALNYFLGREIRNERDEVTARGVAAAVRP